MSTYPLQCLPCVGPCCRDGVNMIVCSGAVGSDDGAISDHGVVWPKVCLLRPLAPIVEAKVLYCVLYLTCCQRVVYEAQAFHDVQKMKN